MKPFFEHLTSSSGKESYSDNDFVPQEEENLPFKQDEMPQVQPDTRKTRQQSGNQAAVEEINWGDIDEEVNAHCPEFTGPCTSWTNSRICL